MKFLNQESFYSNSVILYPFVTPPNKFQRLPSLFFIHPTLLYIISIYVLEGNTSFTFQSKLIGSASMFSTLASCSWLAKSLIGTSHSSVWGGILSTLSQRRKRSEAIVQVIIWPCVWLEAQASTEGLRAVVLIQVLFIFYLTGNIPNSFYNVKYRMAILQPHHDFVTGIG